MRAVRRLSVRFARLARKPRTARWLLLLVPALVLVVTFAGWRWTREQERDAIRAMVELQTERLHELVAARLDLYAGTTVGIAERWRLKERATAEEWAYEATTQSMVEPALDSLQWITPELEWRWSGPEGDPPELTPEMIEALDSSRETMEPAIVGPLDIGGEPIVQISVPVVRGVHLAGWVTAHYRFGSLARSVLRQFGSGFSAAFLRDGRELFERQPGDPELVQEWSQERVLDRDGVRIALRVWPTPATLERARSAMPQFVLVGGSLLAVALTLLVGLIQVAAERAREAEMNDRLQEEIRSRRRAERSLERRARELARSNREFEQFAYAVSHDLKDPLNALAMNLQLAQTRHGGSDDGMERPLRAAHRSVERMNSLLSGLLEYARAGGGGEPELVDADDALDEVLDNLEDAIHGSGARITRGELPKLVAHRTQLVRLLQNLVGNALKFRGEADPEIHVDAERTSEGWHFQVRDNGVGLEASERERAFDLFWRPSGTSDGSGVGLAVCKRVAEAHGGRIWVESNPGEGSTFHFILGYDTDAAALR